MTIDMFCWTVISVITSGEQLELIVPNNSNGLRFFYGIGRLRGLEAAGRRWLGCCGANVAVEHRHSLLLLYV